MAWYDEAVFYHIYPLGMLDAPKVNDYGEVTHRLPELLKWIPHFKEIGVNAIYIGPLFESVGHGYETTDYKKLDRRLGDNADLKDFVKNCHDNGIRVIFDGVFNHTGRDFFAFKDIRENRENSRYRDWYCNVNFWGNNEYNDGFSYDNWGGYNLLAKLNQKNPEVRDYIADVIRFWVSEFDVDGIRLDAADVLDFDFMKMLRWLAGEVKPDFWLMGEVIHGDYTRWVNDGTLHAVTNYTLHKALYSGHNDHNYFEIAHTVKRLYDMGGNRPDGLRLYNFSDNHDVERIITKLNNKANYLPVHILVYTLPGVPSVYYGSEFGIEGEKKRGGSDDAIRPALKYEDYKDALKNNPYTKIIAALGKVRNSSPALSYGHYREVMLTNRQYVFSRKSGDTEVIIAVNNDENPASVSGGGLMDGEYTGTLNGNDITVSGGGFSATIPANSGEIWVAKKAGESRSAENLKEALKTGEAEEISKTKNESTDNTNTVETVAISDGKPENIVGASESTKVTEPAASKPVLTEPKSQEKPALEGILIEDKPNGSTDENGTNAPKSGAAAKYNLSDKYSEIDPDAIKSRSDYDSMSIEELQVAILEKMAANGPVNDQMVRSVMDNVYPDSLKNWVKSFR